MKRYYIDTETTGLDAALHEMIDICIIVEDIDGEIIEKFSTRIKPQNLLVAESRALQVNGYSDERWKDASQPSEQIADRIIELLHHPDNDYYQRGLWVGQNPRFDKRFIDAFLAKYGSVKLAPIPMLDTRHLSIAMFWPKLNSYSLDAIRQHMELPGGDYHTAESDCSTCRIIVFEILNKT